MDISYQVSSFFAARYVCWYFPERSDGQIRNDSGINRTQMGKHNRSVIVTVYGIPWVIPPRKH
jgi:hypothetical protein